MDINEVIYTNCVVAQLCRLLIPACFVESNLFLDMHESSHASS